MLGFARTSIGANFTLHDSHLVSGRDTVVNVTNQSLKAPTAKDILQEHIAFGALFNAKERFDPPKCHEETRKAVRSTINRWADDHSGDSKPILWLRGAMGAGKSAIAQTSAERWEKLKVLAASFFFSRTGTGRNNSSQFVATLAYQIALSVPSTWTHMREALLDDIGVFKKSLRAQMETLIIEPLKSVAPHVGIERLVVVIDGLDECCVAVDHVDHESQQREILDTIAEAVQDDTLPLCFLIASRPEMQIRTSFASHPLRNSTYVIDLSNEKSSSADIQLFLGYSFDEIRATHPLGQHLDSSWPPRGTIPHLLEKSSGHFIYAATAMKHIARPRHDPQESLHALMNATHTMTTVTSESPFAELDALYMLIMQTVTATSLPIARKVFQLLCFGPWKTDVVCNPFADLPNNSPRFIEKFFFLPSGSSHLHLVDLHSLVQVPRREESNTATIHFIHASFSQFLTHQSRSRSFGLDKAESMEYLQTTLLKHIYIEILSPRRLIGEGFVNSNEDSAHLFSSALSYTPPSEQLLDGLLALFGDDQQFLRHIHAKNLGNIGTTRNIDAMAHIFGPWRCDTMCTDSHIEMINHYIKRCGVNKRVLYPSWRSSVYVVDTDRDLSEDHSTTQIDMKKASPDDVEMVDSSDKQAAFLGNESSAGMEEHSDKRPHYLSGSGDNAGNQLLSKKPKLA